MKSYSFQIVLNWLKQKQTLDALALKIQEGKVWTEFPNILGQ